MAEISGSPLSTAGRSTSLVYEDSEEVMDFTRRLTLLGGFLLMLLGCLSGLMFLFLPAAGDRILGGPTPAVGVAHKIGCMEAMLLIAIAATWHLVHLNARNRMLAVALCFVHAYGNWFGTFVAAWMHAGGASYDPSFTCSMMNAEVLPNAIVNFLLNLSLQIIPLLWILMLGTLAKDCKWCSQRLISIGAWLLIATSMAAAIYFLTLGVVNPLIHPEDVDTDWPMHNVKNRPMCPYAVMRPDDYVPTTP